MAGEFTRCSVTTAVLLWNLLAIQVATCIYCTHPNGLEYCYDSSTHCCPSVSYFNSYRGITFSSCCPESRLSAIGKQNVKHCTNSYGIQLVCVGNAAKCCKSAWHTEERFYTGCCNDPPPRTSNDRCISRASAVQTCHGESTHCCPHLVHWGEDRTYRTCCNLQHYSAPSRYFCSNTMGKFFCRDSLHSCCSTGLFTSGNWYVGCCTMAGVRSGRRKSTDEGLIAGIIGGAVVVFVILIVIGLIIGVIVSRRKASQNNHLIPRPETDFPQPQTGTVGNPPPAGSMAMFCVYPEPPSYDAACRESYASGLGILPTGGGLETSYPSKGAEHRPDRSGQPWVDLDGATSLGEANPSFSDDTNKEMSSGQDELQSEDEPASGATGVPDVAEAAPSEQTDLGAHPDDFMAMQGNSEPIQPCGEVGNDSPSDGLSECLTLDLDPLVPTAVDQDASQSPTGDPTTMQFEVSLPDGTKNEDDLLEKSFTDLANILDPTSDIPTEQPNSETQEDESRTTQVGLEAALQDVERVVTKEDSPSEESQTRWANNDFGPLSVSTELENTGILPEESRIAQEAGQPAEEV